MSLLPEVRAELVATATRRAAPPGRHRAAWPPRVRLGHLAMALGVGCTLAVVAVALLALRHPVPRPAGPAAPSSLSALEAKLAILRRPQTPADRGVKALPGIARLTRLAATVDTTTAGRVRVWVLVSRLPIHPSKVRPEYFARAAVTANGGQIRNGSGSVSAAQLGAPSAVASGLLTAAGAVDPDVGVTAGLVADGVMRVKWTFSGVGFGVQHPHPVTVYPRVQNNVAVAPVVSGQGPLVHTVWYGAGGSVIASAGTGTAERQELQEIRAINAARHRPIAAELLAHYSLFSAVPAVDLVRDQTLLAPYLDGGGIGGGLGLNYWDIRYVGSLKGIDGRGLWVVPGGRGVCISDPQATACGALSKQGPAGITGPLTGAGDRETLAGLVPDGNSTVTLVLAGGSRVTVPVVEHNVFEATVRGRIVAIINRDTSGRLTRRAI
jgi:hypothetical protein